MIRRTEIQMFKKETMGNHNISCAVSQNTNDLQKLFQQAPDLVIRQFQLVNKSEAALIYLSGLTDKQSIHNNILPPLMHNPFDVSNGLPVTIGEIQTIKYLESSRKCYFSRG